MTIEIRDYLAKLIEELLIIVKIAMPPDLFLIDPQVKRAQAYLIALGRPSPSRPPNAGGALRELLGEVEDLRTVDARGMVLDWDLVDAVLTAREQGLPQEDSAALNFIVRDWLTAHGYLPHHDADPH